jgi:diguanylate cyclase (GGDEF)-like protein
MPNMAEDSERRRNLPRTATHADVAVELTQMTFRGLMGTMLATGIGLAGTTALLASHYHDRWLWAFTALIALLAAARAGVAIAYRKMPVAAATLQGAKRWQMLNASLLLAYSLSMAGCTLYSFREHDSTAWTLCTLGTFMLCAGMAARVGLYPRLVQASGLAMLGALALAVVTSTEPLARVGILLICLFGYAYFQSVQNRFELAVDAIRNKRTLSLLSSQDALTGLANRRHFEATLATTCVLESPFAILFIEVESFSRVVATHGRAVGDVLLQRVGNRLKNSVRRGDVVARVGEEDFAILQVHGASQQSAESLSRRIFRAIATPFEIEGESVVVSARIGIRLSTAADRDVKGLMERGHPAIYTAEAPGSGVAAEGMPVNRTA